jgi:hypothetical protein
MDERPTPSTAKANSLNPFHLLGVLMLFAFWPGITIAQGNISGDWDMVHDG